MKLIDKIIVTYLKEGLNNNSSDKIFFASLLAQMKKIPDEKIGSMGVTVKDGIIYLYYSEKFLDGILEKEGIKPLLGAIEHELLHIVFFHCQRSQVFHRQHDIHNLACDISVNQLIGREYIPKDYRNFPEDYNLPPNKNAEFYYNELIKKSKKMKVGAGFDNHDKWQETTESTSAVKETIKGAIKEAYDVAKKQRGTLGDFLEQYIKEILKPPTISWKTLLKQYIAFSLKSGTKMSWKRQNKRFPVAWIKGKTSDRTSRILISIDTSGSVGEKDFEDFITEIRGIMNSHKCQIDLIEVDTDIKHKQTLKPFGKLDIKFKGGGGTEYKPAFDYLLKNPQYDLLIYFTDFYCDFKDCRTYKPVIWVLTKQGDKKNKPPFGRVVEII